MKKFLFLFLMSIVLIGFSSCGKDTDEEGVLEESISSPTAFIEVNKQESGLEIVVNSSTDWTATSDADWCTVGEPAGGTAGTSKLMIWFKSNTTGAERKSAITLKTVSRTKTLVIPVTQSKD